MNISRFILPLLLGMLAMPALAQEQESVAPDVQNADSMDYKDYTTQREKILKHMEATSPQQREKTPGQKTSIKEDPHDNTYGQGYGSRKEAESKLERPDTSSQPERPVVIERPDVIDRPDVIERIERPSMGRP